LVEEAIVTGSEDGAEEEELGNCELITDVELGIFCVLDVGSEVG
jgi:hypothetical protein